MRFNDLYGDDLRLCILPPMEDCAGCERNCIFDRGEYDGRLARIQKLRGEVFLADGAIKKEDLDEDGGYRARFDRQAWHVYLTAAGGEVCACCTAMLHRKGVEVDELRIYDLVRHMESGKRIAYESAIDALIKQARERNIGVGEAAAWAIHESVRNRRASMMIAVAGWSIYQTLGEALVIGAPTLRHHTASIEKRFGGFPLMLDDQPLGPFYDADHGCEMEFVWFDSTRPAPKFASIISEMRAHFENLKTCDCKYG